MLRNNCTSCFHYSRGLKNQVESASPRSRDVKTQSIGQLHVDINKPGLHTYVKVPKTPSVSERRSKYSLLSHLNFNEEDVEDAVYGRIKFTLVSESGSRLLKEVITWHNVLAVYGLQSREFIGIRTFVLDKCCYNSVLEKPLCSDLTLSYYQYLRAHSRLRAVSLFSCNARHANSHARD